VYAEDAYTTFRAGFHAALGPHVFHHREQLYTVDTQTFPQRFVSKYDFIDEAHGKTPVHVAAALANDLAQFDTENGNDVFVKVWEEFSFWIAKMPAMGSDAAFVAGFSGLPQNVMVDMHIDDHGNEFILIEYEPTHEETAERRAETLAFNAKHEVHASTEQFDWMDKENAEIQHIADRLHPDYEEFVSHYEVVISYGEILDYEVRIPTEFDKIRGIGFVRELAYTLQLSKDANFHVTLMAEYDPAAKLGMDDCTVFDIDGAGNVPEGWLTAE
jgi:hypothetical protein